MKISYETRLKISDLKKALNFLSQNRKLLRSSLLTGINTLNFDLPARLTCPKALECLKYCYASKGSFKYPNVISKFARNFEATKKKNFVELMNHEIKYKGAGAVRIHSSGDFYNKTYLNKWIEICLLNKKVIFYAYSKSLHLFKNVNGTNKKLPKNLIIIYSYGGKLDKLINVKKDRHAIVYKGEMPAGYAYANENDHVAIGKNKKIALKKH
jgi:hypothetical protein